MSQDYEYKYPA